MSSKPREITRIINGIADYDKEAPPYSVGFMRRVDVRSDPRRWKLQPLSTKESGSIILDLPKWGERVGDDTYVYGDAGYMYKRTIAGVVTNLRQVASSHGNGMKYFGEDDTLYYASDKAIGKYGYIGGTPVFTDDFLTSEGGVPLNTHSMDFEAGSEMSAYAADSASLSIVADLTIEGNFKFESLPAAGSQMALVAKWTEQNDDRSYKMVLYGVSGVFGDGNDGALTIAASATQTVVDSAAVGTSGAISLTATNASFAVGDEILIIQMRGTNAGTWQRNTITAYTAGTITLQNELNANYNSTGDNKAQVLVLNQYTNVTINSGKTWTAKAWNGTVGGLLAFLANGTVTITGSISATGKGFRGGTGAQNNTAFRGEGINGDNTTRATTASGNAGGGSASGSTDSGGHGGGGGGNGTAGTAGQLGYPTSGTAGAAGAAAGNAALTTMVLGGGGGGGSNDLSAGGAGGTGGGIIFFYSVTLTVTGTIVSAGNAGAAGLETDTGGGGAGGSILMKVQTATLGSTIITASGGDSAVAGGDGGDGRIHLDYLTSYTGTTSPALNATEDSSLSTDPTYHLRLYVSSDGTDANSEAYTKEISGFAVDAWRHFAIAWDASASTAYFYVDGESTGTATGALTAISDNASVLNLAADMDGSGDEQNWYDGLMDDVRVWNDIRTAGEIAANREIELVATEAGLVMYHELDNSASDSHANANNLTLVNTPTYSTDVPFSSPTTRQDIDQTDASDGNTYTLAVAIDEGATHRQTFVPAKDPQKSIQVNINTIGTGDWTLTVHDSLNREIATATVVAANLNTSYFEFIFDTVWTPVIGASYHFHLTSTVADGVVVVGTANNLETAEFTSYYQFLVTDTAYHPIDQVLNKLMIGNGRYIATLEGGGSNYDPHRLTFPSGFNVRCIADWREFKAIGIWLGDSIEDYDMGYIFFWDGTSDTYNFWIPVPEGGINAMFGSAGTLYIVAGYQGDLLEYSGGEKARKVKRLPKLTKDKQIEILPGSLTMWRTLLRIGAGVTDSAVFEQGVYTYGKLNEAYQDSLTYDHFMSTETAKSASAKIGMLLPVGKKLLVGWKDNVSYGLDSIDPAGNPVPSGSIEFPIMDRGLLSKEKKLERIRADFEPLVSGESVGLQHKLDRADDWSSEESETTADETELRTTLGTSATKPSRNKEYQVRVNLATTTTTSPKVLGVAPVVDDLENEEYS